MRANLRSALIGIALNACLTPVAFAQAPPEEHPWARSTALFGSAGVSIDNDQGDAWAGGAFGWQVSPRLGVVVAATWVDRQGAADGFGADLSGEFAFAVLPGGTRHYLQVGVGAYRASFDTTNGQADSIPAFYRDRISDPRVGQVAFTDPTLVAGYGVELRMGRQWAARPSIAATFAMADGRVNPMVSAGVQFGYRFEDRQVTPSRRTR
jgi:hypothetical protein